MFGIVLIVYNSVCISQAWGIDTTNLPNVAFCESPHKKRLQPFPISCCSAITTSQRESGDICLLLLRIFLQRFHANRGNTHQFGITISPKYNRQTVSLEFILEHVLAPQVFCSLI